jgi:hypothetical protein
MSRIEREKQTVGAMIRIYCKLNHGGKELCAECSQLWNYAWERLENCPFESDKPTCIDCSIHCYKRDMKERVRQVMRFSGPKMLLYHPYLAIMHLVDKRKSKDSFPEISRSRD